jgi:hypothetical protein
MEIENFVASWRSFPDRLYFSEQIQYAATEYLLTAWNGVPQREGFFVDDLVRNMR